jgi:hypothetical protein
MTVRDGQESAQEAVERRKSLNEREDIDFAFSRRQHPA